MKFNVKRKKLESVDVVGGNLKSKIIKSRN